MTALTAQRHKHPLRFTAGLTLHLLGLVLLVLHGHSLIAMTP